jgi:CO/xanthine dehydrogenase FAD-binding subunit
MTDCIMPTSLEQALRALADAAGQGQVVVARAGATDIYPAAETRRAWFTPADARVLDLSRISELRGIRVQSGETSFGAAVTWTELVAARLSPAFDGLKAAARQVGGQQIQNRGTLGGNICNASPAADGVPPLLALDAEVELASLAGLRRMPLTAFIQGNRQTALRPDELLTRIIVPEPAEGERSVFLKLGARSYLVISIASVAVNLRLDAAGRVASARIALGACSAVPLRLGRLEQELRGSRPEHLAVLLTAVDGLAPIDDVRASARYRAEAAGALVRRSILACAATAREAA